jgi:hypothetical protein
MRYVLLAGLVGGLSLTFAAGTWAADIPWNSSGTTTVSGTVAPTPATTAADPGAVTKTETGAAATTATTTASTTAASSTTSEIGSLAKDPKFAIAVKPIEDMIAQAAKIQGLYDKEMAKPEKSRNLQNLDDWKTGMAKSYLAGSAKAKAAGAQFSKDEEAKKLIAETYEKPLRAKAIEIYMEQAEAFMAKKEYRRAITLFNQVLQIETTNQAAKDGLKLAQDAMKPPAPTQTTSKTPASSGGGGIKDVTGATTDPWQPATPYVPSSTIPGGGF